MPERSNGARMVALVGPAGSGKTSLAEALLFACNTIDRQGSVEAGNTVADASAEARARGGSTEMDLLHCDFMGDRFVIADVPGAISFAGDGALAIAASDLAILVVDPEPDRAVLAQPALRQLETLGVPHLIFVNKIDNARGGIRDLLAALQPISASPLIARQIPIRDGEKVSGFVDVALERAYHYRPGQASEQGEVPADLAEREASERNHLLEQLADHDDALLEQLLMDEAPARETVFTDLANETRSGSGTSVLFGSAQNGFGVRRLLKALRHETPAASQAGERLGATGNSAFVFKIANGGAIGRLALARLFGDTLSEGSEVKGPTNDMVRIGSLFAMQGEKTAKQAKAQAGDALAIAKLEEVKAGDWLGGGTRATADLAPANCTLAIATNDRKDDVRLTTALNKLVEEDPSLSWTQDDAHHETRLTGISDEHLQVALARLKRRYGVAVSSHQPTVGYKESIRKVVTQRGRHKKQSGGHGQFGDVVIDVRPQERGAGFRFDEKITGGAVPKQYIPAVEQGVRDAMQKGPMGFPVVDVAVTLTDGSYHTVDSSELAFRTAGRIAMQEALEAAGPHLLEPVSKVEIVTPDSAASRVTSALASRRGQMLGLEPRDGWNGWQRIEALIPEGELHGFDAELRSLSQGLASYQAAFDHLAELNGKRAEEVAHQVLEPA